MILMRSSLAFVLAVALGTIGCAAFSSDSPDGVQVAAAFYPLQFVADRVAGGHASVSDLTTPGKEPHDLEPTVRETALIARADLVIHEAGLQPSIDEAVAQNAGGQVIDAAAVVGLQPFADAGDHSDEEIHTTDDGHDHEGDLDPHFWLDPLKMADLGDAVAVSLADIDPENADDYRANAASLRSDLEAVDHSYTAGLADCARTTIVVSHDAFGYLGRYGLEIAPIAGLSPDAEPTPRDLADLQTLITADGITTVFGERLAPRSLTDTLAADMGVGTAVLDPIEGLSSETESEDYLSLMGENLDALEEANACQ
ncbi:zinc ABC transporter substrate-binding protein [soil metagenome]